MPAGVLLGQSDELSSRVHRTPRRRSISVRRLTPERTRRLATSFGRATSFGGPHENIPLLRPERVRGGSRSDRKHLQQILEPFDHAQSFVLGDFFVL